MPDTQGISAFLQGRLRELGLHEVSAVDAAVWLDRAGLLADSDSRPGKPLRDLLRAGHIAHAEQRPPGPNGRWFIVRGDGSGIAAPRPAVAGLDHGTTAHRVVGRVTATPEARRLDDGAPREGHHPRGGGRDTPIPSFTRSGLSEVGFTGFVPFKHIDLNGVPREPGVYVVLRETDVRPVFLPSSPAGWFKGQDPTVPIDELETGWPDGAHCVYIGKADDLRRRISQFRQYGDGRPVGHQGGRRIWQLADADDYVLAWRPTPATDPEIVEGSLIRAFMSEYRKRPIGNRTSGRRTA